MRQLKPHRAMKVLDLREATKKEKRVCINFNVEISMNKKLRPLCRNSYCRMQKIFYRIVPRPGLNLEILFVTEGRAAEKGAGGNWPHSLRVSGAPRLKILIL